MAPTSLVSVSTPTKNHFRHYDHVTWYVSNAKQTASFFVTRMGFNTVAYQGLETGSKDVCSYVVQCGDILLCFKSALRAIASCPENGALVDEIHRHVSRHGDSIKDIAFKVDNVQETYEMAISHGAKGIQEPVTLKDKFGSFTMATVAAYGDTNHTLVDREQYHGVFMPGFQPKMEEFGPFNLFGPIELQHIDHAVGNQDWNDMEKVCKFYESAFGFHRFWSVDERQIHTKYSALRSTVMASEDETIKMPMNEPAEGLKRSQIDEFIEFNDGPGVQHVAFLTPNIIDTVESLRRRGVEFMEAPSAYYDHLEERLAGSKVHIKEALADIKRLNLLVDFDDQGYLLQIFTEPISDRPTFFFEIIQRDNFDGFGAGNFKSLFESIEKQQEARGTL